MKFKTLMIIKALVCLALGLPILLAPDLIYSIFGLSLADGGAVAAREYGAAMLGTLMITWFARNAQESDARWAIALGLFVYDAIGFAVILIGTISGLINPLGWLIVAVYLFFTVGFGFYTVKSPRPAVQARAA